VNEREGSQRERGATTPVRPEGRGPDRREERAPSEREGSQRERGATTPVRPEGRGPHRREERALTGFLVVVPMRVERAALGRRLPGAMHTGMGARRSARAVRRVRAALDRGVHSGLLIVGVCGALVDRLGAGDLVLSTELRGPAGPLPGAPAGTLAEVAGALRAAGLTVHIGPTYTADRLVDRATRSALAATGALAVDTESAILAAAAGDRPVLVARAVSDGPRHPLFSPSIVHTGLSALRSLRVAAPVLAAALHQSEREVG
jgi:4-hydroxy-3-methylbut-2-enyl diphosphate reductase